MNKAANNVALARQAQSQRKVAIAQKRIARFQSRYGEAHLSLLYQAALPVALTPDLLYRIWANFQRDAKGDFLEIPWIAVSDILLSDLCQEVGEALYEIEDTVREQLLLCLQSDSRFGQRRIQELSDFLLEYVRNQLESNDLDVQDLAKAQRWGVLAYTQPGRTGQELALSFQSLMAGSPESIQQNKAELARMAALVGTLSTPLSAAGLLPLIEYAHGVAGWVRGDRTSTTKRSATKRSAIQRQSQEADRDADGAAAQGQRGHVQIAGVMLPILDEMGEPSSADDGFSNSEQRNAKQPLDFSYQRLRGRSFKGADLVDANFQGADIRGANFMDANLAGANFQGVKAGLKRRWLIALLLVVVLLSVLSGMGIALVSFVGALGVMTLLDSVLESTTELGLMAAGFSGLIVFGGLVYTLLKGTMNGKHMAFGLSLIGAFLFIGPFLITRSFYFGSLLQMPNIEKIAVIGAAVLALLITMKLTARKTPTTAMFFVIALLVASLLELFWGEAAGRVITWLHVITVPILTSLSLGTAFLGRHLKRPIRSLLILGATALSISVLFGIFILLVDGSSRSIVSFFSAFFFVLFSMPVLLFAGPPLVLAGRCSMMGTRFGILIIAFLYLLFLGVFQSGVYAFLRTGIAFVLIISVVMGLIAWSTMITLATAMNLVWAESNSRVIAASWTLAIVLLPLAIAASLGWRSQRWAISMGHRPTHFSTAFEAGVVLASVIVILGVYVGWRAMSSYRHDTGQFAAIREVAVSFASIFGTSFYGADLTDADFTDAVLKNADFRTAMLTRTRWFHTRRLDCACVEESYLQGRRSQRLAITHVGNHQNYDGLNMQGMNLQAISLTKTSFVDTNLNQANLQNADLSGAKLIGTQLAGANLFGVCLTGAYIQNVTITDETNLQGIACQYIFTKLPTESSSDSGRLPADSRQIFEPGELVRYLREQAILR